MGHVGEPPDRARAARVLGCCASAAATPVHCESRRCWRTFNLSDALDDGAPAGTLSYLELLVEVLEDCQVTASEQAARRDVAELYDLSDSDVVATHCGFVRALARKTPTRSGNNCEDAVAGHGLGPRPRPGTERSDPWP